MIAGIGGASLGTEIYKCLQLSGGYELYGCEDTFLLPRMVCTNPDSLTHIMSGRENYEQSVIEACHAAGATCLIRAGSSRRRSWPVPPTS